MNDTGSDTFVEISNRDIYNKLIQIEDRVIMTNGRVGVLESNVTRLWLVGGGAITTIIGVIVFILSKI